MNNKKTIYSFLGLPASGKGTQSEIFATRKNLPLISIGDLVREEIEENENSTRIKDIKKRYDNGIPQTDEVVFDLIKRKLNKIDQGAVFDNFPFSSHQAELLFDLIQKEHWDKPTLIYIDIKPETSYERILNRRICPNCGTIYHSDKLSCTECKTKLVRRSDDNEETLSNRIELYLPRIREMLEIFNKNGKLIRIDGEPSIAEITQSLKNI